MTPGSSENEEMGDAPFDGPLNGVDLERANSSGLSEVEKVKSETLREHQLSVPENEIRPSTPIPIEAGKEMLRPDYTVSRSSLSGSPFSPVLTDDQIVVLAKDVVVNHPEIFGELQKNDYPAMISDHGLCLRNMLASDLLTFACLQWSKT